MSRQTDADRLDWFEAQANKGGCPALIFNDNGWWAVLTEGVQSLDFNDPPEGDFSTNYFCPADECERWKPTVRDAIDHAMNESDAVSREEGGKG